MKLRLVCDIDKCSACGACVIACMDQNDIDTERGDMPRRRAVEYELPESDTIVWASMTCVHCGDAPCVVACPTGCMYKDEETGFTLYDKDKCIGCHSCAVACPYGAPCFDGEGKIYKCDGCVDRRRAGMEPACVLVCPADALSCEWVEDDAPPALHLAKNWLKGW